MWPERLCFTWLYCCYSLWQILFATICLLQLHVSDSSCVFAALDSLNIFVEICKWSLFTMLEKYLSQDFILTNNDKNSENNNQFLSEADLTTHTMSKSLHELFSPSAPTDATNKLWKIFSYQPLLLNVWGKSLFLFLIDLLIFFLNYSFNRLINLILEKEKEKSRKTLIFRSQFLKVQGDIFKNCCFLPHFAVSLKKWPHHSLSKCQNRCWFIFCHSTDQFFFKMDLANI